MVSNENVIVITGPTASGKTAASIELCKQINGEVVCADSMQIYKMMNIGTAKPTKAEMQGITHHLLDIIDPTSRFSVADYKICATNAIKDIFSRGKTPVVCGGTGQYLSALIDGTVFTPIKTDLNLRKSLEDELEEKGIDELYRELEIIDPKSAITLHKNDTKRILRAIEVYRLTGMTKSFLNLKSKENGPDFNFKSFCITHEREVLYQRINNRVDNMINDGLIDEIKNLIKIYPEISNTAYQAIGYKEFIPYLNNEIELEEALNQVKQATRNYAKRQLTWFRKMKSLFWIENKSTLDIVQIISNFK